MGCAASSPSHFASEDVPSSPTRRRTTIIAVLPASSRASIAGATDSLQQCEKDPTSDGAWAPHCGSLARQEASAVAPPPPPSMMRCCTPPDDMTCSVPVNPVVNNNANAHKKVSTTMPTMKASAFKTIPGIGSAMAASSTSFIRMIPVAVELNHPTSPQFRHSGPDALLSSDRALLSNKPGTAVGTAAMMSGLSSPARRVSSSVSTAFSSTGTFPTHRRSHPRSTSFTDVADGPTNTFNGVFAPPPPLLPQWPAPAPANAISQHNQPSAAIKKRTTSSLILGRQPPHSLVDTLRPRPGDNSPPMPPTAVSSSSAVTPTASTTVFAEEDDGDALETVDTLASLDAERPQFAPVAAQGSSVHNVDLYCFPMAASVNNPLSLSLNNVAPPPLHYRNDNRSSSTAGLPPPPHQRRSIMEAGANIMESSKRLSSSASAAALCVPKVDEGALQTITTGALGASIVDEATAPRLPHPPSQPMLHNQQHLGNQQHSIPPVASSTNTNKGFDLTTDGAVATSSPQKQFSSSFGSPVGSMFVPKPPPPHHQATVGMQQNAYQPSRKPPAPQAALFRWHPLKSVNMFDDGDKEFVAPDEDDEDGRVVMLESMSTASTATIQSKRSGTFLQKPKRSQHHHHHRQDGKDQPQHAGGTLQQHICDHPASPAPPSHNHPLQDGDVTTSELLSSRGSVMATVVVPDLPGSPPPSAYNMRRLTSANRAASGGGGAHHMLSAFSSPVGALSRGESARGSSGGWWSSVSSYSETPVSSAPHSPRR